AIEQIPHFQPEKVPRAKPGRFDPPGLPLAYKQVPEAANLICVDVNLIAQFTSVTGPSQQAGQAADHAITRVMELEFFERYPTKTHEQLARFGTLNGHLGQFDRSVFELNCLVLGKLGLQPRQDLLAV